MKTYSLYVRRVVLASTKIDDEANLIINSLRLKDSNNPPRAVPCQVCKEGGAHERQQLGGAK